MLIIKVYYMINPYITNIKVGGLGGVLNSKATHKRRKERDISFITLVTKVLLFVGITTLVNFI